jgi:hypothetical protein
MRPYGKVSTLVFVEGWGLRLLLYLQEKGDHAMKRSEMIAQMIAKGIKVRDRMKPGYARDRKSRWLGCLEFARLTAESEERGTTR